MKQPAKILAFAAIFGVACAVSQTYATSRTSSLQLLDSDHDGTVDLN